MVHRVLIILLSIPLIPFFSSMFVPTPLYTSDEGLGYAHGVNVLLDGLPKEWLDKFKLHTPITVDGYIHDWYTEFYWLPRDVISRDIATNVSRGILVFEPGGGNKFLYYRGEFVWFDAEIDTSINRSEADLVEVRVSGNKTHLLILVRVKEIKTIGSESNESLMLSIPIDTDMNWSNGRVETVDPNTNVSNYAPWDYQIVLNVANPDVKDLEPIYGGRHVNPALKILNASFTNIASNNSYFVVNKALSSVEVAIYWNDIGVANPWNVSNVRVYALAFIGDTYGDVVTINPGGSNVVDCLSNLDTGSEVEDGVISYWVDVGFSISYEPVSYGHIILDEIGLTQVWLDLSNDYRSDYIVDEAFDVDLLLLIISMDPINDKLYVLIHLKGDVRPRLKASPAIAIAIDRTPFNATDGYASRMDPPVVLHQNVTYKTETDLGCPVNLPGNINLIERDCKWDRLIWFSSWVEGISEIYEVAVFDGSSFTRHRNVNTTIHFIEFEIPLSRIDSELHRKDFRLETAVFARNLVGIGLYNITGSNLYDVLAPYPTWGQGIEEIRSYPYAKLGEVYDSDDNVENDLTTNNGDHWVDAYHLKKYRVVIESVTLLHVDYDGDGLIELGEYLWVKASMVFFNGTTWLEAGDKTIKVYFVSTDFRKSYYLGYNLTDEYGVFYLYLDEVASRVPPGSYYLMLIYEPTGVDVLFFDGVDLLDSSKAYSTYDRPFTAVISEPPFLTILLLAVITVTLLMKRYLHNRF